MAGDGSPAPPAPGGREERPLQQLDPGPSPLAARLNTCLAKLLTRVSGDRGDVSSRTQLLGQRELWRCRTVSGFAGGSGSGPRPPRCTAGSRQVPRRARRSRALRKTRRSSRLQPIVLFICYGWSSIRSSGRSFGARAVSSHVSVRFLCRRAVMWSGARRSICYCSNSARGRMRFRWAQLCAFRARASGQLGTVRKSRWPAPWTRCSPPRGPAWGLGPIKRPDTAGSCCGQCEPPSAAFPKKTALGGTSGVEKWPCAPAGPSPAWGGGCRGLRAAPLGYPSGTRAWCPWGCPPVDTDGGSHPEEAARAPRPLAAPWDRTCSKSGLADGPGQRRGPVRPGYTGSELAHDARRGAKG